MQHFFLCVLAGVLPTSTSPPAGGTSVAAEIRLKDGSVVKATVQQEKLEVMTEYGTQTIPFSHIRRIHVGRHVPGAIAEKISKAIKDLGSANFKIREQAPQQLFELGTFAYPAVKKATDHPELEIANRASQILKKLNETLSLDDKSCQEEDCIEAKFRVVGRILEPKLKAYSPILGELTLKLSDIRQMQFRGGQDALEFTVDATKYGSAPDQWLETGLLADPNTKLTIKSEGQVDLWPQGPGQYMTGPKGYTTAGKGGTHMAGTLLGRIGTSGKTFVIGDQYDAVPTTEGRLYLHIVPSPWNNASAGNYKVKVSTDFASSPSR